MGDSGVFDFGVPDDYSGVARAVAPSAGWNIPAPAPYTLGSTSVTPGTPSLGGYNLGNVASTLDLGGDRGAGGGDWWSKIKGGAKDFGDIAKATLPFASLGATGVGISSSIQARNQAAE